ncbi:hypothetical protein BGLA2_730008 [Burkholderia gladioli]|nr:hypothetical protein BGLA2_730008 [Burkholderia gladioli]
MISLRHRFVLPRNRAPKIGGRTLTCLPARSRANARQAADDPNINRAPDRFSPNKRSMMNHASGPCLSPGISASTFLIPCPARRSFDCLSSPAASHATRRQSVTIHCFSPRGTPGGEHEHAPLSRIRDLSAYLSPREAGGRLGPQL